MDDVTPPNGLADIARHVMRFHSTRETRVQSAFDEVAGNNDVVPPNGLADIARHVK